MATVTHRWVGFSADGKPVLFEVYADNTIHLVVAPDSAMSPGTHYLPIDECSEALYDRHGTLIVSREP